MKTNEALLLDSGGVPSHGLGEVVDFIYIEIIFFNLSVFCLRRNPALPTAGGLPSSEGRSFDRKSILQLQDIICTYKIR